MTPSCNPQETASFDIPVTDTDAKSYQSRHFVVVLQSCEQENKQKCGSALSERRITIILVCSVDGVLDKEFQFFLKKVSETRALIMDWIRTRLLLPSREPQTLGGLDDDLMSSPSTMVLDSLTVNTIQFGECFNPFLKTKLGKVTTGRK